MKPLTSYSRLGLCLAILSGPLSGQAATIWDGPVTTFVNSPGSDPTLPANQDRLTANVWISRGSFFGIFNAATETGFTHFSSPQNTEWADGTLANYSLLSYEDWNTWAKIVHTGPPNTVGVNAVVHLISEDIYLSVRFTSWGGPGGGFSWERSTPHPANVAPTVTIISPTDGTSYPAPGSVSITTDAEDSDGSVTNVSFFDGATFLGQTNSEPYTVTTFLAAGSHSLTAIATDDLGLSTTSAVVNVTVNVGNTPPSVTITNPVDNAVLSASANLTIRASATDSDGSVTNVQFFDGAVSLGNDATSPYSVTVRLEPGLHTLTAVASDNLGAKGTSAPVHVDMARYLPAITNGTIPLFLLPVATGMAAPLYAISPPGDTHRLFVAEQNGLLRIVQDGVLLPGAALDIQSRVQPPLNAGNPNDERGFLGLAFHPGFNTPASPGYRTLYTYNSELIPAGTTPTYPVPTTAVNNYKNVVNEWKISSADQNVVDPASRREVISFGKTAGNHNGGTIDFGPDGYIYLALGDGGDANDVGASHIEPGGNAQNMSTPLGKMLRFDPLHPSLTGGSSDGISTNGQYRIPGTNPFKNGLVPEIYAIGLRNPYRFCFDTANGDLIMADVGQNNVEEIDRIVIGGNYGWPVKEGDFLFNRTNGPAGAAGTIGNPPGNRSPGSPAGLIDPISGPLGTLEYDHNDGISITGGFVYRGSAIPELYGKYIFGDLALKTAPVRADGRLFYADLEAGTIHAFPLVQFGGTAILPNGLTVHGFGQDADGELYALVTNTSANGTGGIVYKLALPRAPTVTIISPTEGTSYPAPGPVSITASAEDSDGSVTNVSFFDGVTFLGQTNSEPYTVTTFFAAGSHSLTAVATDDLGLSTTSAVVNVTVNVGNTPPSVTITNPVDNAVLSASANLTIRASATDSDGSVTNVQFFDGAVSLGNDATSPFNVTVRLDVGLHTLIAVASDNLGAKGTSAPVHVDMARYLPAITNGTIPLFLLPVATGMAAPLYAISPPGDTHRLFVAEQNGLLRIVQDGVLLPGAALDIQSRVQPPLNAGNPNDERGFLGLAFHPGFNTPASPGYRTLYTYNSELIPAGTTPTYPVPTTAVNNYKNVVNEWKISSTDQNVVDPASRREVISFGKTAGNHNGGTIDFGPDGYIYLALGDGGDANDVGASHIEPGGNAQNLSTPLGKMLRFDPLHPSLTGGSSDGISTNGQYRIPAGNPFKNGLVPEIYAIGLRNPYRFCFDTANGDLIMADVGQNNVEEIDRIVIGGNYGWPVKEGDFLFNRTNGPAGAAGTIGTPPGNRSPGSPAELIDPISGPLGTLEYDHNDGISITGGFVYRGSAFPELYGKYIFGDLALRTQPVRADGRLFYADLEAGTIHAFPLVQFGGTAILPNGLTVHGFGQDADGELYALVTNTSANGTGGIVYKLASTRLAAKVSGNNVEISWLVAGGRLQSQTNTLNAANWADVPDSATTNRVLAPIGPGSVSVFYRLIFP